MTKPSARRTKRPKAQPALILAGHGVSLRVENGALTTHNGFTHYPQREIFRYFCGDAALPERIILLDGSGSISCARAMRSAYAGLSRLEENLPETISELRILEVNCATSYFRSWIGMPARWRGMSRRPIPDGWRFVGVRSSPHYLAGNRKAAHSVNAILDYAHTALESDVQKGRGSIEARWISSKGHVFDPADFVIRSDGVCWLNPEIARMVVARVSTVRS